MRRTKAPFSIPELRTRLDAGLATPQDLEQISWIRTARRARLMLTPAERLTKDIGDYVRAYRENRLMTTKEFALRAGVHKTYVSQVECGHVKHITLKSAIKLLQGCGVTLEFKFKKKPN